MPAGEGRRRFNFQCLNSRRTMKHITPGWLAGRLVAGLALAFATLAAAQEYTVTTLAGPQEWNQDLDGTGGEARLTSLIGLAVDGVGNLYVTDSSSSTIRKVTPDGVVATLAGLAGSSGAADGAGSTARFNLPHGVAVDMAGNVYVADWGNDTIRKVTPDGVVTTLAGQAGVEGNADGAGSGATFNGPSALTVDSAGNLYVTDDADRTIRKVSPAGVVTTLTDATGNVLQFYTAEGVVVDGAGNLYVAETHVQRIMKVTPDGVVTTLSSNEPLCYYACGLAIDGGTNLYMADSINHTIGKLTPGGVVTTLAGLAGSAGCVDGTGSDARFDSPYGLAVDHAGNLFVAMDVGEFDVTNLTSAVIRKVTPDGTVTTLAGLAADGTGSADGTGAAAQFNHPTGAAVDVAGNVYVADSENSTIRKVTPDGTVTTLAGLPQSYGSVDGIGSAARFNSPIGVAVDSASNVYVADNWNHTIRKLTPDGLVTTLAGLPGQSGTNDGTGSAARFFHPCGVAVDSDGNVYVADYANHTVRKVTPAGEVTTVAGLGGTAGSADGTGGAARFNGPFGLTLDGDRNLYVADSGNCTIRKVAPDGGVTTLAGMAGSPGSADGTGSGARFYFPRGVALDCSNNLYVADYRNQTIRRVTPGGVVTTLAGLVGICSSTDGPGAFARFSWPSGLAADRAGNLYVADEDNGSIRLCSPACPDAPTIDSVTGLVGQARQLDTTPKTAVAWQWHLIRTPPTPLAGFTSLVRNPVFTPPVADLYVFRLRATNTVGAIALRTLAFTAESAPLSLAAQPLTQTAESGSAATFSVQLNPAAPDTAYQWYFNGTGVLAGATAALLRLTAVQSANVGAYTVVVSNSYGCVTSAAAVLSVIPPVPRRNVRALSLTAAPGSVVHVDYANALSAKPAWQALGAATLTTVPQAYVDPSVSAPLCRFYRAWETGAPITRPALEMGLATELTLTGTLNTTVRVDYICQVGPTNAWATLASVTLTNSPQPFCDLTMWGQPGRLYRVVPAP